MATSASSFLTFQNGTGRTGSGSLTFAVTANTGTIARTGTGTVAGKTLSVSQAAPPQACTYAISPASANAPAAGVSGTIAVTTSRLRVDRGHHEHVHHLPGRNRPQRLRHRQLRRRAEHERLPHARARPWPANLLALADRDDLHLLRQSGEHQQIRGGLDRNRHRLDAGRVCVERDEHDWVPDLSERHRATGSGSVAFSITENSDAGERNGVGTVAGVTVTVAQAGTSSTPPPPLKWSSDFDGDGKNDILVQDSVLGIVEAWFLDNGIVKGTRILSDSLDTNWTLAGRGDFNGDNKPDLVWQHKTDGTVTLWYMDGTTRIGSANVSIGQGDPQWRIVGVGDFNADQHPDLVWQNDSTGALSAWLMNGSAVFGTASLVPDKATDVRWKVAGVADVNMDGKPDLLWRHLGTGEVVAWLMNGLSVTIQAPLSPSVVADQRWQVGAVTDVNGDGKPDSSGTIPTARSCSGT